MGRGVLAPACKGTFTASVKLRDKLDRLTVLMLSSVSYSDLAAIVEVAVTEKLERLEAKRFAEIKARRKSLDETDTTMDKYRRCGGSVSEPMAAYFIDPTPADSGRPCPIITA